MGWFSSLRSSLTTAGLLVRTLATLRRVSKSLEHLATTQSRLLKLELIRANMTLQELDEAEEAPVPEGGELFAHQSDEELARLEDLRLELEAQGYRIRPEDDPDQIANA